MIRKKPTPTLTSGPRFQMWNWAQIFLVLHRCLGATIQDWASEFIGCMCPAVHASEFLGPRAIHQAMGPGPWPHCGRPYVLWHVLCPLSHSPILGVSHGPVHPASQPASHPTSQLTGQRANQPAAQPAGQPANQPSNQASQSHPVAASQPASRPAGQPACLLLPGQAGRANLRHCGSLVTAASPKCDTVNHFGRCLCPLGHRPRAAISTSR